jgi:hypothetical protein
MEGEASSEGDSDRKRGGGGDDNSDENNNNKNNNNGSNSKIAVSNEGQSKPKRQMKTPFQLETLEKAYACKLFILITLCSSISSILFCFCVL